MPNRNFAVFVLSLALCACNKSQPAPQSSAPVPSPPNPPAASTDNAKNAVQQKLKELAGSGSVDCGQHTMQAEIGELKTASDCALGAAKVKKPFLVTYTMPGMTNAIAGNAEGKLFVVQVQGSATGSELASGPCPAELRVASSGRVTCFQPGSMSLNNGGGGPDPHAGMGMSPGGKNPHGKSNPHGGLGIPEPMAPPPSHISNPPQ